MPRKPLDEAAIRALASRESFERGRDYWRRGAVSELVRRGNELTAEVQGSDIAPYRVTVRFDDAVVLDARCTCPYDWGGSCKHIVATLLKLANEPGAVEERPPVRDLLNALDRDRLMELMVKRLDHDPEFAGWIEAELATAKHQDGRMPVDPSPLVAQTRAVLAGRYRQRRYWDDYRSSGDAAELQALVEKAVPFLEAGDGRNALRILEAITETFVEDWVEYKAGSDEHMYTLFADLGRMMAEAALMSDLEPEERDNWATTLAEWQDQLADFGLDESFEVALRAVESGWDEPELRAVLAGEGKAWPPSGRDAWREHELTRVRLRVLDACGSTEEYLNLARATGARASVGTMLVRLGRTAEAMAYGRETFTAPGEALELAKALREAGQHDEALALAEFGLKFGQDVGEDGWDLDRSLVPLAHWTRDYAGALGRIELALTAAISAFEHTLSLQDYRAVAAWAGERWAATRPSLLACLTDAQYAPDRVEILLGEGMVDEAVRALGEGERDETVDSVIMELMDAAHTTHPDWVIRFAERKATQIMEAGASDSYELAGCWLERAALAYDALGRIDEWTATIEGFIDRHRRKYKLRPILEALRLRS